MKPIVLRAVHRAAVMVSAAGLLLAPLAAQARENRESAAQDQRQEEGQSAEPWGRGGAIDELNFGPVGMNVIRQRQGWRGEGDTRLLSGRVVDMKGRTLYVEREGLVVPLDVSALRIHKTLKVGQQVIAEYQVDQTQNVALSLAGEVAPPTAE